jgi:hypothetical protein
MNDKEHPCELQGHMPPLKRPTISEGDDQDSYEGNQIITFPNSAMCLTSRDDHEEGALNTHYNIYREKKDSVIDGK